MEKVPLLEALKSRIGIKWTKSETLGSCHPPPACFGQEVGLTYETVHGVGLGSAVGVGQTYETVHGVGLGPAIGVGLTYETVHGVGLGSAGLAVLCQHLLVGAGRLGPLPVTSHSRHEVPPHLL